jgi:hypothetical protein
MLTLNICIDIQVKYSKYLCLFYIHTYMNILTRLTYPHNSCLRWLSILHIESGLNQGCQMVYYQTKNTNLGKFWRVLHRKMLVSFMAIWSISWLLGIFYGNLVYFTARWYILRQFGIFYGNLVYLSAIWYILRHFGIFDGNLVYFTVIWYIFLPFWYVVSR